MNAEEHNTKDNINRLFSNPNYVKSYIEPVRLRFYKSVASFIVEKGMSYEGKRIADVGCATSHLLNHIDHKYDVESLVGIDFASETLKIARSLEWKHDAQFYELDLHDSMDEFIGAFDIVFSTQTLEHVRNPTKIMENILPTLTPEGVLMITVPDGAVDGLVGTLHINSWDINQLGQFIKNIGMSVLNASCYEIGYLGVDLWAILWNKSNG